MTFWTTSITTTTRHGTCEEWSKSVILGCIDPDYLLGRQMMSTKLALASAAVLMVAVLLQLLLAEKDIELVMHASQMSC